ncbi:Protein argonaute [Elasticomyces elasticus]|nr:Protein argonaute [Elasticomyces elasticus]
MSCIIRDTLAERRSILALLLITGHFRKYSIKALPIHPHTFDHNSPPARPESEVDPQQRTPPAINNATSLLDTEDFRSRLHIIYAQHHHHTMSPSRGNSRQSARSPSPAGSDASDVIVFTGRQDRTFHRPARSEDHLLAPENPPSTNNPSTPRSAPLPDSKHAGVTAGSIAPRRAQKREYILAMECHELENGQHSKPQLSPSAPEDPASHGNRVDGDAEVVVAVHRLDAIFQLYGPRYGLRDAGHQPTMPGHVATSPRYKPSHVSTYDMVDDRPVIPEHVATSPRYKPKDGLEYDQSSEPRYDPHDDRYPSAAPKYIPESPEYSLASSLNSTTSTVSTGSSDASHSEMENNDEIEAARQEEAEKLEKFELAINSLAERERELQIVIEACNRASDQFLEHRIDEEECDHAHAEWARLRENYEEEVMWPSRVLYEQISDGVKKSMFEGIDLGDPDFVFPSMTTMLRGRLEQRVKESAARAMKASTSHALREPFVSTKLDTLEAPTQSTSSVAESTIKCSLSPHGHDSDLGVPETKDGTQRVSYVDMKPNRTHPLSKGTAYQFEVDVDGGMLEESLAGKVLLSRAIQKALGAACVFDGNSTAWSLEPLGQKRAVLITPSAKHIRGTPLPPSHILLRQTRCSGVAVPKHYLDYLSKSDAHGHFNHDGESCPARRSGTCSGCKAEVQQMISDVLDRERRVVVSRKGCCTVSGEKFAGGAEERSVHDEIETTLATRSRWGA